MEPAEQMLRHLRCPPARSPVCLFAHRAVLPASLMANFSFFFLLLAPSLIILSKVGELKHSSFICCCSVSAPTTHKHTHLYKYVTVTLRSVFLSVLCWAWFSYFPMVQQAQLHTDTDSTARHIRRQLSWWMNSNCLWTWELKTLHSNWRSNGNSDCMTWTWKSQLRTDLYFIYLFRKRDILLVCRLAYSLSFSFDSLTQ